MALWKLAWKEAGEKKKKLEIKQPTDEIDLF